MKYVVITGVSTGMGRATAEDLVQHGYHVFGSVRKQAVAAELQTSLGQNFTPLLFDVTDEAGVKAAAGQVAEVLKEQGLTGLVNNAGIAVPGPLVYQSMEEVRRHFEVHVFGTLMTIQAFAPLLGVGSARPPGRIVNVSSVGGKITTPFLGAYTASKHALESMSDALRRELNIFGVYVSVIEPGAVRTAIWDKAEQQQDHVKYEGTVYGPILERLEKVFVDMGRSGMAPEVVSRAIRDALESPRPKPRYALPDKPIVGWLLPRMLPDRWLDRILTSQMGLSRRGS